MKRLMILLCAVLFLSATAKGAEPTVIKPAWEVRLPPYGYLGEPFAESDEKEYRASHEWCRKQIETARKHLLDAKRPVISPYEPRATGGLIIAATIRGPWAVPMEIDKSLQAEARIGQLYWEFLGHNSMTSRAQQGSYRALIESGFRLDLAARAEQIFGHSLNGIGSVSAERFAMVDDQAFYPRASDTKFLKPSIMLGSDWNFLEFIAPDTGKITAKLGTRHANANALSQTRFLGAPLISQDRLFAINEKGAELRLLVLDAKHQFRWIDDDSKGIAWQTALVSALQSTVEDFPRRIHALIPIATDKLIICPTHLGAVVAVNRDDHKVAWTARYGKPEDKRFENFSCTWRVRPLLMAGDVLVYGPPDAESLYAFKLADGKEAWKLERGKGVYLAGLHDGKAIVVESDSVRAIDVSHGKEVWKVPFEGTLTGYGAFNGDRCYQPIGLGKNAAEGVLQVIDLKQGKAVGRIQRADKKEFGNLLIHKGKLISQTFESLSVFAMP